MPSHLAKRTTAVIKDVHCAQLMHLTIVGRVCVCVCACAYVSVCAWVCGGGGGVSARAPARAHAPFRIWTQEYVTVLAVLSIWPWRGERGRGEVTLFPCWKSDGLDYLGKLTRGTRRALNTIPSTACNPFWSNERDAVSIPIHPTNVWLL